MFFRESVGYSWSPACHATLRKVDCHLYGRAVLGQASFMLGRRGRSLVVGALLAAGLRSLSAAPSALAATKAAIGRVDLRLRADSSTREGR